MHFRTRFTIAPLAICACIAAHAQLPAETLSTAKMPPPSASQVFVADLAFGHIVDGRVTMFDARSGKLLGAFSTGYMGQFSLTPDRRRLIASSTINSRLVRGDRLDLVQIYDLDTLNVAGEVTLPPRRGQALPYRGLLEISADGRRAYVQNANPASSVTVVDLENLKVVTEVPTLGCWAVYPASEGSTRFSTMCGDGTLLTITLDEIGKVLEQHRSPKFFDADADALFIHGERVGTKTYFISFKGMLHATTLDGPSPVIEGAWPLVPEKGPAAGWRPGGYTPFAIDPSRGSLYLSMHPKGTEGSHKLGAKEIWTVELANHKLARRTPAQGEVALTVTREESPLLLGVSSEKRRLTVYDARSGRMLRSIANAGDTVLRVESR